jgi:hypothetical protein
MTCPCQFILFILQPSFENGLLQDFCFKFKLSRENFQPITPEIGSVQLEVEIMFEEENFQDPGMKQDGFPLYGFIKEDIQFDIRQLKKLMPVLSLSGHDPLEKINDDEDLKMKNHILRAENKAGGRGKRWRMLGAPACPHTQKKQQSK